MRNYPLLGGKTLDAVYSFCQQVGKLRDDDRREVDRLNLLTSPQRILYSNTSPVGNAGSGEDDLMSYVFPDGIFRKDGYFLEIEAGFATAANANNKTVRMYLGSTLYMTTGASAANTKFLVVKLTLIRTGASGQTAMFTRVSSDATWGSSAGCGDTTVDFNTADLSVRFTGEATNDNDIVQKAMTVKWFPANIEA